MEQINQRIEQFLQTPKIRIGIILILFFTGICLRVFLIVTPGVVPFNADEAVVGLMARHILEGEIPLFFYGQAYMGSLDALLVAAGFFIFGQKVWVIRIVQVILYSGIVWSSYKIASQIFQSKMAGWVSVGLMLIPPVNSVLYTTISLGGYNEAMLIGNLSILSALRVAKEVNPPGEKGSIPRPSSIFYSCLICGILAGIGFWAFGLSLIYTIPAAIYLAWLFCISSEQRKKLWKPGLGGWITGAMLGLIPIWIYLHQGNLQTLLMELGGSAVNVDPSGWGISILAHLRNFVFLGIPVLIGMRPPWGVIWLAIGLIPFVLMIWGIFLRLMFKKNEKLNEFTSIQKVILLYGPTILLIFGFIFSPFGNDPSGRYFIPIYGILSILIGGGIGEASSPWKGILTILAAILILYHFLGILQCIQTVPPGLTTQFDEVAQVDHRPMPELIQFLEENGETRGYTNYWVAYPLAFFSQEEVIFVPQLPYHQDLRYTPRDDRYPPYEEQVRDSDTVAYITTKNPSLDQKIIAGFRQLGVSCQEKWIGEYHIFYRLSSPVTPVNLGIGADLP